MGFFLVIVALEAHNCRMYVQKPSATEDSLQIGDYNHDIYNFVFHGVLPFLTTEIDWQDGQDGRVSVIALLLNNYLNVFLHPFLFRTTK